jgi:hypothetical protein
MGTQDGGWNEMKSREQIESEVKKLSAEPDEIITAVLTEIACQLATSNELARLRLKLQYAQSQKAQAEARFEFAQVML